jgi:hypothetical protein
MRIILVFSLSISFYLCRVMDQYKSSFKQVNYITDTVGHIRGSILHEDFNKKFREWEIRRGFRSEDDTVPTLRGISLRHSRSKKKTLS